MLLQKENPKRIHPITAIRTERKISRLALAREADISPNTLFLIEEYITKRPNRKTMRDIAKALGVEVESIT